jgi:hypothetical protein|tara:strand:- start:150 stop:794 length:645 start_codon:yes stop_codon:yes gene_type:complete
MKDGTLGLGSKLTTLTFPNDITILSDSIECGHEEILFDQIKSIRVHIRETTTILSAVTGIPTIADLDSAINIYLVNGERIDIKVSSYKNWGPFQNKNGLEKLKGGLSFVSFLEKKTFKQRMAHYLATGTNDIYFKYRGYEFLNNKTIRLGGKHFASFDPKEYEIKLNFKEIYFEKKDTGGKIFDWLLAKDPEDKGGIKLTQDEDVILHLIKKIL